MHKYHKYMKVNGCIQQCLLRFFLAPTVRESRLCPWMKFLIRIRAFMWFFRFF